MAEGKRVTIAGGGPVGALQACYLSKRGYKVDLYESRGDIRKIENASGRSINLALSYRGIEALKQVGLDERVKALGIPMHGRMIHQLNGKCYFMPYGKKGQYLLSVDRMQLNRDLLSAASTFPNVNLHFKHKFVSCDLKTSTSTFVNSEGSQKHVTSDVIMGCDGAHSGVRRQLQRHVFDYSQEYIPHGYKELTIPPDAEGKFAMPAECLHIWPRHEFMLIALPNQDCSFTCTIFMPFKIFEQLTDGDKVMEFFNRVFPDSVPLIGEDLLRTDFFLLPPLPLISVKCSPYHFKDKVVLFGDAAHACVPFFGQGLNSGLEDVLAFNEILDRNKLDIAATFSEYSRERSQDGHAVAELSKQNYIEMRSSVLSPYFQFRKKIDNILGSLLPSVFTPRYEMIAFTRIRYHDVINQAEIQRKWVNRGLLLTFLSTFAFCGFTCWRFRRVELERLLSFFRGFSFVRKRLALF